MYGVRDDTKLNDQSKNHILNYSRDKSTSTNSDAFSSTVHPDMHQKVMAFERKLQYDNLVHSGVNPVRAAQQVGKNVPLGSMLTPKDIQQIIETGTVRKSRVG